MKRPVGELARRHCQQAAENAIGMSLLFQHWDIKKQKSAAPVASHLWQLSTLRQMAFQISGDHETTTHGIAHHVGHLVNNASLHSFTVMVNEEDICFNCHARENGRHLLVVRDRQKYQRKWLVYVIICCLSIGHVVLHMSDVGENWFSVGTRFLLETFHCGLVKRTKERQFDLLPEHWTHCLAYE